MLEVRDVRFRYRRSRTDAVRGVSFAVHRHAHTAILGPNGAGKSTLLRLVLGLLEPAEGSIRLWGRSVREWGRRALARRVGVVSQDRPPDFPITVRDFVELGRNPHLSPWRGAGEVDRTVVRRSLERTDIAALAERRLDELSGGELQRAKLARALAQEPAMLLLDEPTAHLDLGHELQIFALVSRLARDEGLTVVSVTHSLPLAGRFADTCLLLAGGEPIAWGSPAEVLREEPIERAFGWPVRVVDLGGLGRQVVPLEREAEG